MADEVLSWLEEIDMEEYLPKFKEIGVKKIKHFIDCTEDHLTQLGLKPLEITRFLKKQQECFPNNCQNPINIQTENKPEAKKIQVNLPSSAFGYSVMGKSVAELSKEYSQLYYENPKNFKHIASNSFILKMLSAASYRFDTKTKLYVWGRQERDTRWNAMLSFAPVEEVINETQYFKKQNIQYKLQELTKDFKDVMILNSTNKNDIKEKKLDRVKECFEELKELKKWCDDGVVKVKDKLKEVEGRNGYKEAEDFWKKLLRTNVSNVNQLVDKCYTDVQKLYETYNEKFQSIISSKEKGNTRRAQKNLKKAEKRKNRAAEKMSLLKKPRQADLDTYLLKKEQGDVDRMHYIPPISCISWKTIF